MRSLKHNIGYFLPVCSEIGLKTLLWQQTPFTPSTIVENSVIQDVSHETILQIEQYLCGGINAFNIPLDLSDWSPQMQNWFGVLTSIPYGTVWSYQKLAKAWGNEKATRPAGQACKRNPIPIIIPCHRVISANNGPNQYSGGSKTAPNNAENISRKKWLQSMEAIVIA